MRESKDKCDSMVTLIMPQEPEKNVSAQEVKAIPVRAHLERGVEGFISYCGAIRKQFSQEPLTYTAAGLSIASIAIGGTFADLGLANQEPIIEVLGTVLVVLGMASAAVAFNTHSLYEQLRSVKRDEEHGIRWHEFNPPRRG